MSVSGTLPHLTFSAVTRKQNTAAFALSRKHKRFLYFFPAFLSSQHFVTHCTSVAHQEPKLALVVCRLQWSISPLFKHGDPFSTLHLSPTSAQTIYSVWPLPSLHTHAVFLPTAVESLTTSKKQLVNKGVRNHLSRPFSPTRLVPSAERLLYNSAFLTSSCSHHLLSFVPSTFSQSHKLFVYQI